MFRVKLILLVAAVALAAACKGSEARKGAAPQSPQSSVPASEVRNSDGETALLRAVNGGNADEVRRLLDSGAQVDAPNNGGVTPLMNAAGMGNKEMVQMLLAKGADVNHKTPGNYTALMQAALVGQTEMVKLLLDAGADPSVKDTGGRSASDYAKEKEHKDIQELLKRKTDSSTAGKK